ncbi:MAG: hypothetical protein B6244_11000 [Candidatus Cloacimonetes bacterium 4572_55]|nr:MAG: hypothetical protein B6244_11000 [Candidatus Cloacimonetes bacterium 4572_55]
MKFKLIFIAFLIHITSMIAAATIINVPDDYSSIQAAINSSSTGDTILVQPGTYSSISFNGKAITVASLLLTNGNEDYVGQTIISGYSSNRCARFNSNETANSVLIGFTLTNGSHDYGAGIYCYNGASPTLRNLIINNNHGNAGDSYGGAMCLMSDASPTCSDLVLTNNSAREGGAIYFHDNSDAIITNMTLANNSSTHGGAMLISYSSPVLYNTVMYGNSSSSVGGAVYVYNYSYPQFLHPTIFNNTSDGGGGVYCTDLHGQPTITNGIIWGNTPQSVLSYSASTPIITYSDIQEGTGESWFGTGCIDADPLFMSADNNDFHLTAASPCIDAGDPNSPLDPDGSVADMGAFYFTPTGFGTIAGVITSAESGQPISGATITVGYNEAVSADDGSYNFSDVAAGSYTLQVIADNYVTATEDVELAPDQTVIADVALDVDYTETDFLTYELEDSPEQQLYPNNEAPYGNTLEDLDWIEVVVAEDVEISGWEMTLTWSSLDYPGEGALWVVSPAGTEINTYNPPDTGMVEITLATDGFNGEMSAGTWEIFIIDSYNDGGHQITDAIMFVKYATYLPPENLTIEMLENNRASLSWDSPDPFGNRSLIGFHVFLDDSLIVETEDNTVIFENLVANQDYTAGVAVLYDNAQSDITTLTFTYQSIGIEEESEIQYATELIGNYPNPFNLYTTVAFSLKNASYVHLDIYNAVGQKVQTLIDGVWDAGSFTVEWDGTIDDGKPALSGVYFYQLKVGGRVETKKMVLIQ